jgi:hypothetical protein
MPNECYNHITITSRLGISHFINDIKTLPNVYIEKFGKHGVKFEYITALKADYTWLETFLDKYPTCWIKNLWNTEDGRAGLWIGYDKTDRHIKMIEWEDLSLEDEYYFFINE